MSNMDNGFSPEPSDASQVKHVSGMYENWFLDYASYVILERAVPYDSDGLKPVQRRILHSMWEMEDGRYNKVANIIGNCMKYHPHGDASIGDALTGMGQKDLLIDCQGNWGNILTGDSAAASRYIEARLSKFALDVAFNPKVTQWQPSYDGRNKEPMALPLKFPLLLAQGVEGIAVGLACKILPHNFNELIDGCIDTLRGKKTHILPDFPTGGLMDAANYNNGLRGGKIKVRARITINEKKQLVITEIPFGTTTISLIDSILAANEKDKIKIKKVEDNTADKVEIIITLPPGVSPDKMLDALYAFTDCEVSVSPNACVIKDEKPLFLGVNEILRDSALLTREIIRRELEIIRNELREAYFFSSLEKLFIREEMYIDFKKYDDKETLFVYLRKCFDKFRKQLLREITDEDFEKLTQIPMIRITRFDTKKADEKMKSLDEQIKEKEQQLANLTEYTIEFYKNLKKKYGKGRERKTEIRNFENIVAAKVVIASEKLYVNRTEGFVGYGIKKDEYVCDCSTIDDIIIIRADGICKVIKVSEKAFVGKDILHVAVFARNDDRTIYNMVYQDGPKGNIMMKRFPVTGVTRDKEYDLTRGNKGSKIWYLTANPNGESEVVTVMLKPLPNIKKTQFDIDFSELAIKGRNSQGNIVTKYAVKKITQKQKGLSTLGARMIWFDDSVQRLNVDARGTYLGDFSGDDRILSISQKGYYRLHNFDLSNHFDEDLVLIEKFDPQKPLTVVYFDGIKKEYFVKRFVPELTDKIVSFLPEGEGSYTELVTTQSKPEVEIYFGKSKGKNQPDLSIKLYELEEIKNIKAKGKKLGAGKFKEINLKADENERKPKPEDASAEAKVNFDRISQIRQQLDDMDNQMTLDF